MNSRQPGPKGTRQISPPKENLELPPDFEESSQGTAAEPGAGLAKLPETGSKPAGDRKSGEKMAGESG